MADQPLVLALDQGTSSSRAILFDRSGAAVASASREFPQLYPAPGHVLHDPEAIWESQLAVAREAIERAGITPGDVGRRIVSVGVTNQRETTVVWDRATGKAVAPAIVWQSRITAGYCDELRAAGHEPLVRERTGLPLDAYFSGPKIRHILRSEPGLLERARRGELAFGTVDSFLLWRLTGGRVHATDVSNASRTLLFDIHRLRWDPDLLDLMELPAWLMPEVRSSSEVYGTISPELLGAALPIAGIAGDQQAATFGQACHTPGMAKNTYGTGAFLMLNTGGAPVTSTNGLLTTVGWQLGADGPVTYALEGAVFVAGAAVQWLRDGLGIIGSSAEVEALADSIADAGGVYLVPAFTGLGAPWWDPYARGTIVGLTRGTGRAEIARATVDSMAYGVADLLDAMRADLASASAGGSAGSVGSAGSAGSAGAVAPAAVASAPGGSGGSVAPAAGVLGGPTLTELRVDGGASVNDRLLAFQADLLGVPVARPTVAETTALGAAYLAGLATGVWHDTADVAANWRLDRRFEPSLDEAGRARARRGWRRAVERSLRWAEPEE